SVEGSGTATLFTNAVQGATAGSFNNPTSVVRANNFIGQGSAGGNYFNGQIAELLVFSRAVTATERSAIEGYLLGKYQILNAGSTAAPTISVPTSTLAGPTQVAIAAPAGTEIRVTTDGTTPNSGSTLYEKPINVYFSQTLKAIAVKDGVTS